MDPEFLHAPNLNGLAQAHASQKHFNVSVEA
jgi:hypothetical protein